MASLFLIAAPMRPPLLINSRALPGAALASAPALSRLDLSSDLPLSKAPFILSMFFSPIILLALPQSLLNPALAAPPIAEPTLLKNRPTLPVRLAILLKSLPILPPGLATLVNLPVCLNLASISGEIFARFTFSKVLLPVEDVESGTAALALSAIDSVGLVPSASVVVDVVLTDSVPSVAVGLDDCVEDIVSDVVSVPSGVVVLEVSVTDDEPDADMPAFSKASFTGSPDVALGTASLALSAGVSPGLPSSDLVPSGLAVSSTPVSQGYLYFFSSLFFATNCSAAPRMIDVRVRGCFFFQSGCCSHNQVTTLTTNPVGSCAFGLGSTFSAYSRIALPIASNERPPSFDAVAPAVSPPSDEPFFSCSS